MVVQSTPYSVKEPEGSDLDATAKGCSTQYFVQQITDGVMLLLRLPRAVPSYCTATSGDTLGALDALGQPWARAGLSIQGRGTEYFAGVQSARVR